MGPRLPMIDGHGHYTVAEAEVLPPAAVLAKLDAAGVRRIVVSGAPPELAQRLYRAAPGRVIPLLGVYGRGRDKADWMRDASLPQQVAAALAGGPWAGIGELHLFARDADKTVFADLVRLAAAHDLVLMLHGDAEVVQRALELAPSVRVLWAHLGTEPRPELLAAMLDRYADRLWIDTSVRDERIAPDGRLLPEWRALFLRHPDRFLVAVDTFSLNRWQHYEAMVDQIRAWVASLPPEVQAKLLHDNAARLFEGFLRR
ncbi:MAG: amidohydrolase family protein [Hydrogenophilaceae bacterium]|nr:amidohydrolase family protein [Hydrogenophilaceae bacterium]